MTNIISLLSPLVSIIIGVLPVLVFKKSKSLFGIAAASYFTAITAKEITQLSFHSFFITPSIPTYLSYGLLTAVLEPGFAYIYLVVFKPKLDIQLGLSYGVYLAFYENAILLGLLLFPDYLILNIPFSLTLLISHIMDRLSSLILHLFWGFSSVLAIMKKDIKYLLISMPYGMVDSLTAYIDLTRAIPPVLLSSILLIIAISCLPIIIYEKGRISN
ncbi:hypothetical protein BFU36_07910 [Sulfolobus sp. A20]|uniref:hypothetical protein n=1 Tax=Saccharolobus sp. A20 TaxID=1891280 RepID=UPI00084619F9|nr:hypothetical protein [Sulfolobus sp. A20]TRM75802.1 hypothetical protein DJ532_09235 [Sulfolobus sp. A20-N-F8]TRM75909.1 hypothetical protein DJ523_02050 [Sulfolobus sp. E5]TRM78612.1 hypothetical protein DJ528_04525 [Sulfolobus sp. B5]TRM83797.1 hypothetical protein DJ531_03755 [Sulfolobus sp. A20-N-F6]TRM88186.1 hypothetical protein DJ521_02340 [Sulfolobus sp. E3]TRM89696.1 hypothetical protein DJ529_01085 [Sulfolobus sp. C3]TRN01713.1 hypothetical protein DJ530_05410 [Sulfolobus sp. E1